MADDPLKDRSDEMEHDLHRLEDHIDDAAKQAEARKGDAHPEEDVAGSWEGEQDRGQGDDPVGAHEDAEEPTQGGTPDGKGADGPSGGAEDADGQSDAGGEDDDELVDEEAASPT
jgi:hypothetical protein